MRAAQTPRAAGGAGRHARRACALAALLALLTLPACAQAQGPGATSSTLSVLPGASAPAGAPLPPATVRDPAAVRTLLSAIHGFTREQLEAASTDVPAILHGFIDDAGEPMLVRRQAVKALAYYPNAANLAFIAGRVDGAPLGLKRLYLGSLAGFGAVDAAGVSAILERALGDANVTVRQAAVGTAARLAELPVVRSTLQSHAASEPDPALRRQIQQALQAR
jgi:hypothetical protein